MCSCSGGSCNCGPFEKAANETATRGASYNARELTQSTKTGKVVPFGKRKGPKGKSK